MGERLTAATRLARVLELLPRAARPGGAGLQELADELGIATDELLRDLQEVYTRSYYHPAGSGDGVQVLIDADQVEVWTTGDFRRPPRLRPREALALSLGLRILAGESRDLAGSDLLALAQRLEAGLATEVPAELLEAIAVNPGSGSPEEVRAALNRAVRARKRCEIDYLKPGAAKPQRRAVDPYVLLAADGRWYLIGHCHRSDEIRIFRCDRIVGVEPRPEGFAIPDGFDPQLYVQDGHVFHSDDGVSVTVRYSARIARWLEELGPVEPQADGSVLVRYRVADPDWLVQQVLRHGPDAEVLDPPEMRIRVRDALRCLLDPPPPGD